MMNVSDDFLELHVLMCRAISKPVRLKLLNLIGKKKVNVSDLQKELDVPLSNLSNHLNDLYRAGILGKEKQGNFVYYFLTDPKLIEGINRMQDTFKSIISKRIGSQY
jgi:DNA-binding transcriptional ArsR family regulator